jgi:hypothetical protein
VLAFLSEKLENIREKSYMYYVKVIIYCSTTFVFTLKFIQERGFNNLEFDMINKISGGVRGGPCGP